MLAKQRNEAIRHVVAYVFTIVYGFPCSDPVYLCGTDCPENKGTDL